MIRAIEALEQIAAGARELADLLAYAEGAGDTTAQREYRRRLGDLISEARQAADAAGCWHVAADRRPI